MLGGWSETQTITLGENQTPTQLTEQEIIGAAIAVAAISAGLGLFVYFKKRTLTENSGFRLLCKKVKTGTPDISFV